MAFFENLIHYIIAAILFFGILRSAWTHIQAAITKGKWDNSRQ